MLRLDKWLAEMTEGSRAEVKKWIRQGRVYVNETKVQRPETKLDPGRDQVTLDGEQIIYEQFACKISGFDTERLLPVPEPPITIILRLRWCRNTSRPMRVCMVSGMFWST